MEVVERTVMDVAHPMLRLELLHSLRALSDPSYQQRIWIEHGKEEGVEYDEFDFVVHFLYDDTNPPLAESPQRQVGLILRSEAEAKQVAAVVKAIDLIFDKYGFALTDAEYVALPEWEAVVAAAQEARKVIRE